MKRTSIILAAFAATLATAVPTAASAAPWQNINQRQASLDGRIDQGIRSGALTRPEAARLRSDFASLARLESNYRRGGLNVRERADLDRRFNALSARIKVQKHDRNHRRH